MKEKNVAFASIVFIVVLISIWLLISPAVLANINYSSTRPNTSTSMVSFGAGKGGRIKLSVTSEVKNGELAMVLYDSKGNAVYELDRAKALETFYTFEESDTYTLAAEYSDFVGKFNVEVFKAESAN